MDSPWVLWRQWLGLPPGSEAPDHYELLGLARFESQPHLVREQVAERTQRVRPYQIGNRGDSAEELLEYLGRAKRLLLEVRQKEAYDRELAARLGLAQPFQPPEGFRPGDRAVNPAALPPAPPVPGGGAASGSRPESAPDSYAAGPASSSPHPAPPSSGIAPPASVWPGAPGAAVWPGSPPPPGATPAGGPDPLAQAWATESALAPPRPPLAPSGSSDPWAAGPALPKAAADPWASGWMTNSQAGPTPLPPIPDAFSSSSPAVPASFGGAPPPPVPPLSSAGPFSSAGTSPPTSLPATAPIPDPAVGSTVVPTAAGRSQPAPPPPPLTQPPAPPASTPRTPSAAPPTEVKDFTNEELEDADKIIHVLPTAFTYSVELSEAEAEMSPEEFAQSRFGESGGGADAQAAEPESAPPAAVEPAPIPVSGVPSPVGPGSPPKKSGLFTASLPPRSAKADALVAAATAPAPAPSPAPAAAAPPIPAPVAPTAAAVPPAPVVAPATAPFVPPTSGLPSPVGPGSRPDMSARRRLTMETAEFVAMAPASGAAQPSLSPPPPSMPAAPFDPQSLNPVAPPTAPLPPAGADWSAPPASYVPPAVYAPPVLPSPVDSSTTPPPSVAGFDLASLDPVPTGPVSVSQRSFDLGSLEAVPPPPPASEPAPQAAPPAPAAAAVSPEPPATPSAPLSPDSPAPPAPAAVAPEYGYYPQGYAAEPYGGQTPDPSAQGAYPGYGGQPGDPNAAYPGYASYPQGEYPQQGYPQQGYPQQGYDPAYAQNPGGYGPNPGYAQGWYGQPPQQPGYGGNWYGDPQGYAGAPGGVAYDPNQISNPAAANPGASGMLPAMPSGGAGHWATNPAVDPGRQSYDEASVSHSQSQQDMSVWSYHNPQQDWGYYDQGYAGVFRQSHEELSANTPGGAVPYAGDPAAGYTQWGGNPELSQNSASGYFYPSGVFPPEYYQQMYSPAPVYDPATGQYVQPHPQAGHPQGGYPPGGYAPAGSYPQAAPGGYYGYYDAAGNPVAYDPQQLADWNAAAGYANGYGQQVPYAPYQGAPWSQQDPALGPGPGGAPLLGAEGTGSLGPADPAAAGFTGSAGSFAVPESGGSPQGSGSAGVAYPSTDGGWAVAAYGGVDPNIPPAQLSDGERGSNSVPTPRQSMPSLADPPGSGVMTKPNLDLPLPWQINAPAAGGIASTAALPGPTSSAAAQPGFAGQPTSAGQPIDAAASRLGQAPSVSTSYSMSQIGQTTALPETVSRGTAFLARSQADKPAPKDAGPQGVFKGTHEAPSAEIPAPAPTQGLYKGTFEQQDLSASAALPPTEAAKGANLNSTQEFIPPRTSSAAPASMNAGPQIHIGVADSGVGGSSLVSRGTVLDTNPPSRTGADASGPGASQRSTAEPARPGAKPPPPAPSGPVELPSTSIPTAAGRAAAAASAESARSPNAWGAADAPPSANSAAAYDVGGLGPRSGDSSKTLRGGSSASWGPQHPGGVDGREGSGLSASGPSLVRSGSNRVLVQGTMIACVVILTVMAADWLLFTPAASDEPSLPGPATPAAVAAAADALRADPAAIRKEHPWKQVACSPDGSWLLVGDDRETFGVYLFSSDVRVRFPWPLGAHTSFRGDGARFVTGPVPGPGGESRYLVGDLLQGKEVTTLVAGGPPGAAAVFYHHEGHEIWLRGRSWSGDPAHAVAQANLAVFRPQAGGWRSELAEGKWTFFDARPSEDRDSETPRFKAPGAMVDVSADGLSVLLRQGEALACYDVRTGRKRGSWEAARGALHPRGRQLLLEKLVDGKKTYELIDLHTGRNLDAAWLAGAASATWLPSGRLAAAFPERIVLGAPTDSTGQAEVVQASDDAWVAVARGKTYVAPERLPAGVQFRRGDAPVAASAARDAFDAAGTIRTLVQIVAGP